MKNINISLQPAQIVVPAGLTHVATSWEKAIYSDFALDEYIVRRSLTDALNLTTIQTQLDSSVLKGNKIYWRYKLHFSDGSQTPWSTSNVYDIENPDFDDPIIVATPDVTVTPAFADNGVGTLKLSTSKYKMEMGVGQHTSTTWTITDADGIIVFESAGDTTNLTTIDVPINLLQDDYLYTVKATYHDASGADSAVGVSDFNSFIVNDEYFTMQASTLPTLGRELFFSLGLKTTEFASIDLELRDVATDSLLSANLNQSTITPQILIPDTLDTAAAYNIKGRLTLQDGTQTNFVIVLNTIVRPNEFVDIDTNLEYLAQYHHMQTEDISGLVIESGRELMDGSILIPDAKNNIIYRYVMEDNKLVKKEAAITIPAADHIGIPYIAIIPMRNGDVVINYGGNTSGLTDQESVWRRYEFNTVNKKFTEKCAPVIIEEHWLSVAVSNSFYVTKDDRIFFVPAREVDVDENDINLSMYTLDYDESSNTMSVALASPLPFNAKRNVSLAGRTENGVDGLYIFGGSEAILTGVRVAQWPRTNNIVYKYDTTALTSTEVATITADDVADNVETMHVFLRRDNTFIIFNSNRLGETFSNQDTTIFDPADNTFTKETNDFVDELPYRSTIALNDGDFIRISGRVMKQQVFYRYISDTLTADELAENTEFIKPINELVIAAGETKNIEDLYIYTKVTIEGTNDEDTGILQWQDNDIVRTFQWDDLIIPATTTMTKAEYEAVAWKSVLVLEGAELIVESV